MNRWQTEAKKMIEVAERDSATIKVKKRKATKVKKRKPWRTRAYKKVARKHPVLAPLVWLGVALLTLGGKSLKWSGIGTVRASRSASRAASRRLATKIQADLRRRKWTTESPQPNGARRREHYQCCGQSFHNIQAVNHHLLTTHRGERRAGARPTAQLQVGATAATAGKLLVLDAERGGGRHRASHRFPQARSVNDLVAHYRPHLNTIGAHVMSINNTAQRLRRAARAFGTETVKPESPRELREICVGIEQAMGAWSEAIDEFAAMLKRPPGNRGCNIAPEVVNPFMNRARDHADECGREFTRLIAAFEVFYTGAIRLASDGNGIPNMDLSKTG